MTDPSGSGNVGLSLGHPSNLTSFSGHFKAFSKVVICLMMIRGRHRGLPYALDRAVMLPNERLTVAGQEDDAEERPRPFDRKTMLRLKPYHTN
jgi:Trk-type K+ transport system membrane component